MRFVSCRSLNNFGKKTKPQQFQAEVTIVTQAFVMISTNVKAAQSLLSNTFGREKLGKIVKAIQDMERDHLQ